MTEPTRPTDNDKPVSENPHANSFRELIVYQKAFIVARDLHRVSLRFPRDERFGLTDQLRRSSRSIGAQIAEAWGKRLYERSFVAKLVDADAEQMETQHWVLVATNCRYLDHEQQALFRSRLEEVGRMLGSMIKNSASFCRPSAMLKETPADYLVTNDDDSWFLNDD